MFPTRPKIRKEELALEDDVPSQTELQSYLGSSLANVLKNYSDHAIRELLGVIPPLEGSDKDLWISPSDQLIGKVALRPPLTDKYTKALTHNGILEIGRQAAIDFESKTEEKMREKLKEEIVEVRKMFEAEKRHALEVTTAKVRSDCEEYIEGLNKDFAKKLKAALEKAEEKSHERLMEAVARERLEISMQLMKKLREEVSFVVNSLNAQYRMSVDVQRLNMIADFNAIMRRERKSNEAAIKSLVEKKEEEMLAQRREFDVQNVADMARLLCTEKSRCGVEKRELSRCFEKQIEALTRLLVDSAKNLAREEATKEEKSGSVFFQVVEIIDREGNKWRPAEPDPEIPQLEPLEEEPTFSIGPSEINLFPPEHYERKSMPSVKSLRSYESLPFCYVEEQLCVRSDGKNISEEAREEKKKMCELVEGSKLVIEVKNAESLKNKWEKNNKKK